MRILTKTAVTALTGMGFALAVKKIQRESRAIDFRERSVLITGGSRGLGLVMARLLADKGAKLALMARDEAELKQAGKDIVSRTGEAMIIPGDVRDQADAERAVEQVVNQYGRLDVLINNAGVIQVGPLDHMKIEDFENAMAVHTWGPLYTMLAVIPHMRRQGGGRIVNIASIGGKISVPHLLPYSTSKFALVGLSDGMRAELVRDRIYVTTVCPGLMRTGSHVNALFKGQHEEEFTWFSIFDALPATSTTAEKAARQVIDACSHGDPSLVITIQARLAAFMNELSPRLMGTSMALFNNMLPNVNPSKKAGDTLKAGWESQSGWAPSALTEPADQAVAPNNELKDHFD